MCLGMGETVSKSGSERVRKLSICVTQWQAQMDTEKRFSVHNYNIRRTINSLTTSSLGKKCINKYKIKMERCTK